MKNTSERYGWMTKLLHWVGAVFVLNQIVVAIVMLRTPADETAAGFSQGTLYNWHKSVGLVFFAVLVGRVAWRWLTPLPGWAPNLSGREMRAIHLVERGLYVCLFAMPLSGFLFVMAGDFGVHFFSTRHLPNVVGVHETLAQAAQWTHRIGAWMLTALLLAHWTIVGRHEWVHHDRYVHRMLPFTHQAPGTPTATRADGAGERTH